MKTTSKLFFLPSIVLLIALAIKLTGMPNHVLFVAGGLLLILVFLIVFLARSIKQATGFKQGIAHVFFFILIFAIIILPFAGMFQQGLIPILIYGLMVFSVIVYFIKLNTGSHSIKNIINPGNYRNFVSLNLLLVIINSPYTGVLPDQFYSPAFDPKYEQGKGTEIYVDEGHNNYHTSSGLYTTFSNILRKDGYVVKPFSTTFTEASLQNIKVLVISNAINIENIGNWGPPVHPAFNDKEIQSLKTWVKNGGSLFLIADHPPFSSAAKNLGSAFGFLFSDKTAEQRVRSGDDLFCRQNNMLLDNELTSGNGSSEYIDSIVTFTGQAFKIPSAATSILAFDSNYAQFSSFRDEAGKPEDITGLSQGAYMKFGKGRLVVFGEAAMFTGQLGAGLSWFRIGLNSPKAKNNYKLLLNLVHWLDHN